MLQIPLFSNRSYEYPILLNELFWRLQFLYNPRGSQWTLSIQEDDTEEVLVSGIPVNAGIDILQQYRPVGNRFGKLLLWDEADNTNDMDFDNVVDFSLYYFLPDEEIPSRFNLVFPTDVQRDAIVTKVVFSDFTG